MKGCQSNQKESENERDLLFVIPGRDRSRVAIMADYFDSSRSFLIAFQGISGYPFCLRERRYGE
jgi:hypothetical protein